MGLFSGSFGTGLITGLASSVDRSMRDAIDRRNSEMSEARKYIQTRQAAKLDAAEAKKQKFNEETQLAFDALATELGGDVDLTYAAFKRLGTAAEVQSYLNDVKSARKVLPAGQKYDAAQDFTGFTAGDIKLSRQAALGQLSLGAPTATVGKVSAADFAVDDPIGRMFGRENRAAEEAAKRLNKRLESTAPAAGPEPMSGLSTVGGIDLSRQVASQEAGFAATKREREEQRFDMEVGAFDQNAKRIDQAMQIADAAEARANRQEATDADQRARDNAREDVADLQRQQQLEREAENHILSKRAAEQGITLNELKIQKEKSPPEFKDFEEMFVYAEQKLAQGGLTPQQRNDFDALRQSAIDGTQAWKEANPEDDDDAQFSPQSVNAVFNAQIKRTMGKAGLYDGVADKVKQITEGNAESYFDNFNQAINAVETTYGTSDETMRNAIEAQENVLAQDVRSFIDKQLAIPAQKSKRLKVFDGSPDELIDNAYTANAYSKGDIVQYNENGVTKYAIWTGRDLYDGDY
jgi:hypothetical protein